MSWQSNYPQPNQNSRSYENE